MVSGAGTGYFYLLKKTANIASRKLALRKFDPVVNQYVIFNEAKLKFSTALHVPQQTLPLPAQFRIANFIPKFTFPQYNFRAMTATPQSKLAMSAFGIMAGFYGAAKGWF